MNITNFKISEDKTKMDITIADASAVTNLNIWDSSAYKDYTLSTNIIGKLSALSTEVIEVTPSDLGISEFDGVYILEAVDPDEVDASVAYELSRYKECIMERLLELSVCEDCLKESSVSINNAHALLTSLEYAIELLFINEIINIVKALNTYCNNDCKSCGSYSNKLNNG